MLVPAGGLDDDEMQWTDSPKKFFILNKNKIKVVILPVIREQIYKMESNKKIESPYKAK